MDDRERPKVERPEAREPAGNALTRAGRWLFEDRSSGRIVVAQWPNWPLWVFLAATVAAVAVPSAGKAHMALEIVAAVALGIWALDEIFRGCNPFRRLLGAAVLGLLAYDWLAR